MYCIEDSTCDIVGTFRRPPQLFGARGIVPPLPPFVTPLLPPSVVHDNWAGKKNKTAADTLVPVWGFSPQSDHPVFLPYRSASNPPARKYRTRLVTASQHIDNNRRPVRIRWHFVRATSRACFGKRTPCAYQG